MPAFLPEQRVLTGRDACRRALLDDLFLFGSPTTVMYGADVVHSREPFFTEARLHEDTEAAFEILTNGEFGFVHQVLSYARRRSDSISGAVEGYDPEPLDRLIRVVQYGRLYLDEAERERRLKELRRDYYRSLASAWLGRREEAYWAYHRGGLATIGQRIRRRELARQVVVELLVQASPRALRGGWIRPALQTLARRLGF